MNMTINVVRRLGELLNSTDQTTQTILRIVAAIFGGYVLTGSVLAVLALALPWPKVEVLFFSILFPPLTYLTAVLWAFGAPSARRAWRDLAFTVLFCGALAFASYCLR